MRSEFTPCHACWVESRLITKRLGDMFWSGLGRVGQNLGAGFRKMKSFKGKECVSVWHFDCKV